MTVINNHFNTQGTLGCNETDVAYTMMQILSILAYLHYEGYVHRDIKPENFLIADEELFPIKLASLSTVTEADNQIIKGMVGTYLYMAPEIILEQVYGKGVDIWSAGIIMYILLKGTHPFIDLRKKDLAPGFYMKEMKQLVLNGNVNIIDKTKALTKEAQMLLGRLLEVDPRKRISADEALRDPWIVNNCAIRRQRYITEIKENLLSRKDLHEVLTNVISVACAPNLKIMILDRMCSECKYARENGYPEVNKELKSLYKSIFYFVDNHGYGFLSKKELIGCTLGNYY